MIRQRCRHHDSARCPPFVVLDCVRHGARRRKDRVAGHFLLNARKFHKIATAPLRAASRMLHESRNRVRSRPADYDWIANNSRSTPIAVRSGGFWFAKPVELADMRGLAGRLPPVRFGVTVERSSPHRLRRPPRFRIAGLLRLPPSRKARLPQRSPNRYRCRTLQSGLRKRRSPSPNIRR